LYLYWYKYFTHLCTANKNNAVMATPTPIAFQPIDWSAVEKTFHAGETGTATWQTLQLGTLRIRMVEYSPGYKADHWCQKGHIVHCIEGCFISELQNGEAVTLTAGMSYVVSDNMSSHLSVTELGARLLIVDGGFLNIQQENNSMSPGGGSILMRSVDASHS
jgi:hypothetical protein